MTFSIVARSDDGASWGVAVGSKSLDVGASVSAARADWVGTENDEMRVTEEYVDRRVLDLLREGVDA